MESIPKKNTPILIVDDDTALLTSIKAMLVSVGMPEPALVSEGERVMPLLRERPFQLVLIDLIMPRVKGMDLLEEIKREFQFIECVIITAIDDVSSAVQAMKFGAYDYLVKPLRRERLIITINNALEKHSIRRAVTLLRKSVNFSNLSNPSAFRDMIAADESMASVFCQTETFASSDYNLLITGETGTGKELLARIAHRLSHRSGGPFIALNMGAFNKTLLEDEMFGHAKGAFTGATTNRKGFFEEAQGGTIFFDEITEMDQELQGKLLRVIQERELYRLGSVDIRNLDIRIIAATNRDIHREIEKGSFRKDLYYRLSACHVEIPPLRKRKKDILPLAEYFMDIHSGKNNKQIHSLSEDLAEYLISYSFPGNVRELENIIATCVLNEKTEVLTLSSADEFMNGFKTCIDTSNELTLLSEIERHHINKTLEITKGNRTKAAELLGISLRTLQRKLKEYEPAECYAEKERCA
jgi:DNA-binding NtrC family response regulator